MKTTQLALMAMAGVALAGCKTEFTSEVPMSQLQNPEVTEIPGTVRLEVVTCDHYEDSRKPSDSLVKAQEMMPRIFPDAEFQECYSQGMDSWAAFALPLPVDRDGDSEQFASDNAFNLTTSDTLPLGVAVPPAVLDRLEEAQSATMMGDLEYGITLDVVNDTGEPLPVTVLSAWVEDQPATLQPMEVPAGESFSLRFSDVLIDRAVETGEATVLVDSGYLTQQFGG